MPHEPEDPSFHSLSASGPDTSGPKENRASDAGMQPSRPRVAGRQPSPAVSKAKARRKTAMSIANSPAALGTPAGLAIAEEAQALVTEANANTQALIETL